MTLDEVKIKIIPESIQFIKMSDETYFSPEYSDYISNSKLGLINPEEEGSVKKYKEGIKQKVSSAFDLGTAVHAMVLQPEYYKISEFTKPGGKLGLFCEKVYSLRKEGMSIKESIDIASEEADYYKGKLTDTRLKTAIKTSLPFYLNRMHDVWKEDITTLYLSDSLYFKYNECIKNIDSDLGIKNILRPVTMLEDAEIYNEYAILAEVEINANGDVYRVKVKAKLDNLTVNHETQEIVLNDLKTTGKPVGYFMGNMIDEKDENGVFLGKKWLKGSFEKFHYYRQMGEIHAPYNRNIVSKPF